MNPYTAVKPKDRTLRVWADGKDITDQNPSTWDWPYTDWWSQGWRPAAGPNSTAPGLVEGGAGIIRQHSTADFVRPVERPERDG